MSIRYSLLLVALAVLPACGWMQETPAVTAPPSPVPTPTPPPLPAQADRAVLQKSERLLTLYANDKAFASMRVSLGRQPVGAKTCLGDYRTPEGRYTIVEHRPASRFYKALKLSYPSTADIARARQRGCHPGGDVMIHGLENGYDWVGRTHLSADWTNGCIAVTNEELDKLWQWLPDGTPVEIRP